MFNKNKLPELESYQIERIDKDYLDLMKSFNKFNNEKFYDENIILLVQRTEKVFKWMFDMIYENHLTKQDKFAQQRLKEQLTRFCGCLLSNVEELFCKFSVELTDREKEIINDLIRIRSICLTDEEKVWMHEKMKEIYGDQKN